MNGYFQLVVEPKGVSLELVPPTEGGESIRVNELKSYLDKQGVVYDTMAINSALHGLGEEKTVLFLTPNVIQPVNEKCDIQVTADKQNAIMRIYPASTGGRELTLDEVNERLKLAHIKYGIDENSIKDAIAKKMYCTDVIIAKGKLPTAGVDAKIVYNFDTNNKARPELKEDGTVDFFKLNTLHHCTQGQVLAEIIPEQRGEDGIDVFGTITKAREVQRAKFDHGRNLQVSEDGLKLISLVDGHASLVNGAVFVSDVYEVDDVNTATGNIEYHGDVQVKGNVCENFSIKTDGSVFVNGVVEGAAIEAGGDITIARGMHGQNKGKLKAGGNIVAKFISSAEVSAKGYVEAEQILNSVITSNAEVNAEAGKALINGGRIVAMHSVNAKTFGSPMGGTTIIEVGGDPEVKKKLMTLQKSVQERSKNIMQLKTNLAGFAKKMQEGAKFTAEQIMNFKSLQSTFKAEQEALQEEVNELNALQTEDCFDEQAYIKVRGTMHSGVAITVAGVNMAVKKEFNYCKISKKGADLISTTL